MMQLICSGLGGQGVLTLGLILANIAASHGKNITWVPSYGSEMRGGVANCTIKISDDVIVSPYVKKIDILVALSPSALEKHSHKLSDNGCIIINSSIVNDFPKIDGVKVVKIPANDIAVANNNPKGMSLGIIGAIIAYSDMVSMEDAVAGIESYFAKKGINNKSNTAVFIEGYKHALKCIGEE